MSEIPTSSASSTNSARSGGSSASTAVRKTPRRQRVFLLREFILDTFGRETLQQADGAAVLDIAGGKGDLSWLLTNADGINAVVVDPRSTDCKKLVTSVHWLNTHPTEAAERSDKAHPEYWPLAALELQAADLRAPNHLQTYVDADLIASIAPLCAGRGGVGGSGRIAASIAAAAATARECTPCGGGDGDGAGSAPADAAAAATAGTIAAAGLQWASFWSKATARAKAEELAPPGHHQPAPDAPAASKTAAAAADLLLRAQLVVGFHPDQATEASIDLALLLALPFVVCPCCVFPSVFTDRRLHGRRVSSFQDFVSYLKLKHPKIRTAELPFNSGGGLVRNTVLYMLPEDYHDEAPAADGGGGGDDGDARPR